MNHTLRAVNFEDYLRLVSAAGYLIRIGKGGYYAVSYEEETVQTPVYDSMAELVNTLSEKVVEKVKKQLEIEDEAWEAMSPYQWIMLAASVS